MTRRLAPALLLLASGCFESLTAFPKKVAPDAGTPDAGPPCDTARLSTDLANCGACGNACPAPLHAEAACRDGRCGRGPCERGFYDVDGQVTPGCESTCTGTTCTLPGGQTVTLTVPAVHDLGPAGAPSSTGLQVPGGANHRHPAAVGPPGGSLPSTNANYRHTGGFNGATP